MGQTHVILWDWDNTLADTFGALWGALNDVSHYYGLSPLSQTEAKKAINQSGRNLIKKLVKPELVEEAHSYFWESYIRNIDQLKAATAAEDTLQYARSLGFINILASNKVKPILLNEANQLNLAPYFDRIIGAGEAFEDKPSKTFTDKALEGFDAKGLIVSIGDGLSDVKMARNYPNGLSILVFTNPNGNEFENEKPDICADNLTHCKSVLQTLAQQPNSLAVHRNSPKGKQR